MPASPQPYMTDATSGGRNIQALILDDSAFDRKRIRRLGAGMGGTFQLQEAPNLKALSRQLDATAFDLVLIDYRLSEGDGFAALDLVRRHAGQRNAATIMITGEAEPRLAVSAMKQGCNDFVAKQDLTPTRFRQTVLAALEGMGHPPPPKGHFWPGGDAASADASAMLARTLKDQRVREALQPTIAEGVRDALVALGPNAPQYDEDPQKFLRAFLAADEFLFRQ